MSTATLEPPAKTAGETAAALPPLADAFAAAMKNQAPEPVVAEVKPAEVKPAETKPAEVKPAEVKPVETKPAAKRSALDAALADDVVTTEPVKDEVQVLLESKDPNWDKARETMKRQSEELKTFREKVAKAAEPAPEILTELKTLREQSAKLKAENDQYRDSVMAIDVKLDPSYQAKLRGRDVEVERVASYVKEAGGDPNAFMDAMGLSIAKRGKHLDGILDGIESSRARTAIEARLGKIDIVDEELETQVSQPHKTYDDLVRARQIASDEHQKQVEAFKASTFEKIREQLPKLSKYMRPSPEDAEGAADFNATLKADLEKAPKLLNVSPEEATLLAFKAARYDSVEALALKERGEKNARIAQLEADLAKFEGAEPGFRGGGKPAPKADYERPIGDVFAEALRKPEL